MVERRGHASCRGGGGLADSFSDSSIAIIGRTDRGQLDMRPGCLMVVESAREKQNMAGGEIV
jgi:hypothetical protein